MFDTVADDLFVRTGDFLVSESSFGIQNGVRLAALPNGGFIAVWHDDASGVVARFYDADGNAVGSEFPVGDVVGREPSVAILSNGNLVISWLHENSPGDFDVCARIFDSTGAPVGDEFTVNTYSGSPSLGSNVTALAGGGFVVTWDVYYGNSDVRAQVYAADGSKIGGEVVVTGPSQSYSGGSTVAALAGGGFVVTWGDYADVIGGAGNPGVRAQLFDASGAKVGGVIAVNSVLEGVQGAGSATALPDGGFIVAWSDSQYTADPAQDGIWFQRFDSTGARVGGEIHVTSGGVAGARSPSVEIVPGVGFLVVWQQSDVEGAWIPHLRGQLFDFNGQEIGEEFGLGGDAPGNQSAQDLVVLSDGQIVAGWINTVANPDDADFRAQILYPLIHGTDAGDVLVGTSHRDFFSAGAGNDHITAGAGADQVDGGAGNDTLDGGAGNDTLDGGAGQDRASYSGAAAGVIVSLANAGAQNTLGDGIDILTSIEDLEGSSFGDMLTGNSGANALYGLAGNDTLDGGAGADQMFGGLGDDIFIVDQAGDVITEAAGEGSDEVRTALAYTLGANLENLRLTGLAAVAGTGNTLDNVIRGNDAGNALAGLAGADKLYGNGGNDSLDGGIGDDYLFGGAGNDSLTGGTGYDRMYGGAGDDIYMVNDADDYAYENAGEGHDQVMASIDHQLRDHVEDLVLTGAALIGKGNAGDNGITGNANANKLYGYEGNDTLIGQGGDDYLLGAEGNDILNGGAGYDRMYGGTGDDTYIVTDTTDYAYENAGEGNDRVVASINHTLRANIEQLELAGTADLRGYGNALDNLILGNSGANLLYGRDGNDSLFGHGGNDILYGENGDDRLNGGAGQDRFYGGSGADQFIFFDGDFAGMASGTADRIHDFSQVEGDRINLGDIDANTGLNGDQAFAFIGSGAFSGTAGELRTQQISGNTYVMGDTNGDGQADFWIRLDGLHTLGSGDFVL
jgi:Ca2+-binding RTX toxin-like protein